MILYYQKHAIVVKQYLEHTLNHFYRECLQIDLEIVEEIVKEDAHDGKWREIQQELEGNRVEICVEGLDRWTDCLEGIIQESHDRLKLIF